MSEEEKKIIEANQKELKEEAERKARHAELNKKIKKIVWNTSILTILPSTDLKIPVLQDYSLTTSLDYVNLFEYRKLTLCALNYVGIKLLRFLNISFFL